MICKSCKYFVPNRVDNPLFGECRRYPNKRIFNHQDYWCSRYIAKV